jgi:hypothetical protein
MPVKIKLGLSLVTILVAAIAAWYQHLLGHDRIQYVTFFISGSDLGLDPVPAILSFH